jgi:hypothetical protein
MSHVENIVIGKPIVKEDEVFATDSDDWNKYEKPKTIWTNERFLPNILVDIGFTKSTSEVRRNRKDLVKILNAFDFLEIKFGKNKCWILVGE